MSETKVGIRLRAITAELDRWSAAIDDNEIDSLRRAVLDAKRIFVTGAGKSGLAVRAFANRLLHLGFTVHAVGEITAPSIREGDLLVVNSSRGETGSIVANVKVAVAENAKVALLTMNPDSTVGRAASVVVKVPGQGGVDSAGNEIESVQTPGSLFEDLCLLTYDAVIAELMEELAQTPEQMRYRHTNLE
jgi:6-phospho-3-hexuloisomerase